MEYIYENFNKNNLIVFSVEIKQEEKNGKWKKKPIMPIGWQKMNIKNTYIDINKNGLALLTGKINNIIVIDIDNIKDWQKLLKEEKQNEPNTVKVISGSGGIHYYFKYSNDLDNVTSKDHCFGKNYAIDIKTNGGCIYVPPTKYYNKNLEQEVTYKWEKNIFEHELLEMPLWIKNLLLNKQKTKEILQIKNKEKPNEISHSEKKKEQIIEEITHVKNKEECKYEDDWNLNFSDTEIENIVELLSSERADNYDNWVNVGMCLHNININYLYIWIKFSQKSAKYDIIECKNKWKSFKKSKDGFKIGSLLMWCKEDNKKQYEKKIEEKKLNQIILSKFPNEKLKLGEIKKISDVCKYIDIKNDYCFFTGNSHKDLNPSMYIEIVAGYMTAKCKHPECFGKTYCGYMQLTKQENNYFFSGEINININTKEEDLVEFQNINLFDDKKLNELVFNSLNGDTTQYAEIIYYFYKDKFNYSEDNDWYMFKNHRWEKDKNMDLRHYGPPIIQDLYTTLLNYYKVNDTDKKKIIALRQTIKNFGNTVLKNNIMTELVELYSIRNDKKNFTKKLDSYQYLLGFNNGVYDLQNFEFRNGKQDDFITMTVGYDFRENYTDKYHELINFCEEIQPNKKERDYMLTYLSIGLIGNQLELFTILTGSGRNGKSKLIELLKITFGEYFGSVQSQLFTRPRPDANSPDPGLLSLSKKRIIIASEPEKNSKLNSGFIKFITGRDSTTLRNCHSNDMVDFTAKFITLLICNDIPECDDFDNAFSKRLRCINFPTEFVDEPKSCNQKKINVNISHNFEFWKFDFMLLLIEYFKKYTKTHELKTTDNILKWTNQYQEDTDLYLQFLNECTEEKENEHIHCFTLYEEFKFWFKNNNPNNKIPSNKEFVGNLRKHKTIKKIGINDKILLGINNLQLTK